MSMPDMSFQFGEYNSLTDMGIICEYYDTIIPPKRSRKVQIPGRDGLYDYGSENYDERTIRCVCKLINQISKAEFRNVAYMLSEKRNLVFWDEPDKYYVAELFDPAEVQSIADRLWLEFELTFICFPFALSSAKTVSIASGNSSVRYVGTADAPCTIILRNATVSPITNPTIKFTYRG